MDALVFLHFAPRKPADTAQNILIRATLFVTMFLGKAWILSLTIGEAFAIPSFSLQKLDHMVPTCALILFFFAFKNAVCICLAGRCKGNLKWHDTTPKKHGKTNKTT